MPAETFDAMVQEIARVKLEYDGVEARLRRDRALYDRCAAHPRFD